MKMHRGISIVVPLLFACSGSGGPTGVLALSSADAGPTGTDAGSPDPADASVQDALPPDTSLIDASSSIDASSPPDAIVYPDAGPVCPNGQCEAGEDCSSCPGDCGPCPVVCGDQVCDASENAWECSQDCGVPQIPAGFAGVVWLHTNVSSWSETSTLSPIEISGGLICLSYDQTGVWPGLSHVGAFVNANPWIFIYHGGQIYAATWEWMRHGQTCKNRSSVAGDHIKQDPFWGFQPRSGTYYGFMVSGLARDGTRNVLERSNVQLYRWP